MEPKNAREWLDLVLDPGYSLLFEDVVSGDPLNFPGYAEQLRAAREKTGCTEAVLVAEGKIGDADAIVISFEFGFLGGSMGVAAGERISRAFERAAQKRMQVIALTASGGARMQEGMLALAQMPATLVAREKLAAVGRGFTCYLRNPTTGGVYASFASGADRLLAEPGATLGFAGPRVAETATGEVSPSGSRTAEAAYDACLVDELIPPEQLRAALESTRKASTLPITELAAEPAETRGPAWDRVEHARDTRRPTGIDYVEIERPLRRGGCDPTIETGVAWFGLETAVVIAQNRRAGTGRTLPAGYRRARLAIAHAIRFGMPIVTLIDTPGADPSIASETAGVANEISETLEALLAAPVPTISLVVGEGGSGGALALAACDRLLIMENAFFSVIGPEGAAAILRRDDVPAVAEDLRLTAFDLRKLGLADRILPEPKGGAHENAAMAIGTASAAIEAALRDLENDAAPSARRFERWRVHR
jgi:acyl-CoA carboxylase subunit beta